MSFEGTIGLAFLLLSGLAVLPAVALFSTRRNASVAVISSLVCCWVLVLTHGVTQPSGLLGALIGLTVSIAILLFSFLQKRPPKAKKFSSEMMAEIERLYIKEYNDWADCGMLGTMNDYYRLLSWVLADFEEECSDFDKHGDAIVARLKEITPGIRNTPDKAEEQI